MRTSLFTLVVFVVCFTCIAGEVTAQGRGQNKSKFVRKLQKVTWTAGIGVVVIDDDGKPFKDLFNVRQSWNLLPFPTRIHLEGLIKKGCSIEGALAYSRYNIGKMLNHDILTTGGNFIAFDANAKFGPGKAKIFDPYFIGGLGYTYRSVLADGRHCPTLNVGLGCNIWFNEGLGINLQSLAKFKMLSQSSNYLMHSLGILFRFDLRNGYKGKSGRR